MKWASRAPGFAFAIVATLVAFNVGCGSNGSNGTGNPSDAGSDRGAETDSTAEICAGLLTFVQPAPVCTAMPNSGSRVVFTPLTGPAPTPMGGSLLDGVYTATRTGSYGATTGTGRRLTLAIAGGGTRMLWSGDVLDGTASMTLSSFRADTSISVSGTRINFTTNCVSTDPSPIPPALDFTVSDQVLLLSLDNGSGVVAETKYLRRGCSP